MKLSSPITIALSKGRIFKDTLPLLKKIGIEPIEDIDRTRKLILNTNYENIKLVSIRATDVPTYVQWGAADFGVTGKDILFEHGGGGLYEPLDLKIAKCEMWVAGYSDSDTTSRRIHVATKYVKAACEFFAKRGQQAEIIKLYGSMELAPMVGLSDIIVDLVESGNTLKANGLVPLEFMHHISSRLVVNKASWKMKHEDCKTLVENLQHIVEDAE
tara:strand:+ start:11893 stop:12537 length:645 start_codon:yes stop_codon:yes gene_type:complete